MSLELEWSAFAVIIQEATKAARGEGLWELLYVNDLVITAESEKEAVRKFGLWKREMETNFSTEVSCSKHDSGIAMFTSWSTVFKMLTSQLIFALNSST